MLVGLHCSIPRSHLDFASTQYSSHRSVDWSIETGKHHLYGKVLSSCHQYSEAKLCFTVCRFNLSNFFFMELNNSLLNPVTSQKLKIQYRKKCQFFSSCLFFSFQAKLGKTAQLNKSVMRSIVSILHLKFIKNNVLLGPMLNCWFEEIPRILNFLLETKQKHSRTCLLGPLLKFDQF